MNEAAHARNTGRNAAHRIRSGHYSPADVVILAEAFEVVTRPYASHAWRDVADLLAKTLQTHIMGHAWNEEDGAALRVYDAARRAARDSLWKRTPSFTPSSR